MRAAFLAFALLASCEPAEPPNWAGGGAQLLIAPVTWQRNDETVELRANGEVVSDGDVLLLIDRVGRVVNSDYDPVAIMLPSGELRGPHNQLLGRIGLTNAAPPWSSTAWLMVTADGAVLRFASDNGVATPDGRFSGCYGPVLRTCTLLAHLLTLREVRAPVAPLRFGAGVGVGL